MLTDFRMITAADTGHNIVHGVSQCQRQVIRLSQTQHFCQIPLRINIQQKDLLALHRQSSAQVVHRSAFPHAAFLVCNGNDLCFCHLGFPPEIDLAACGEAGGYVLGIMIVFSDLAVSLPDGSVFEDHHFSGSG